MKTSTGILLLAGAVIIMAQERFDLIVRNDFFAGFQGDHEALARGMAKAEEALAANPKFPEAMVWHGSGTFYLSGEAARNRDFPKAAELYQKGMAEMAAAVALAPDSVAV